MNNLNFESWYKNRNIYTLDQIRNNEHLNNQFNYQLEDIEHKKNIITFGCDSCYVVEYDPEYFVDSYIVTRDGQENDLKQFKGNIPRYELIIERDYHHEYYLKPLAKILYNGRFKWHLNECMNETIQHIKNSEITINGGEIRPDLTFFPFVGSGCWYGIEKFYSDELTNLYSIPMLQNEIYPKMDTLDHRINDITNVEQWDVKEVNNAENDDLEVLNMVLDTRFDLKQFKGR